MKQRQCNTCEYSRKRKHNLTRKCHLNPPVISPGNGGLFFPAVENEDFCSKWEPIWRDNPILKEAWNQFLLAHKLITTGKDNDEK